MQLMRSHVWCGGWNKKLWILAIGQGRFLLGMACNVAEGIGEKAPIYLYNILGFVLLWLVVVILSIHPSSSVPSSVHPSSRKKKMMEREEDDDSWRVWSHSAARPHTKLGQCDFRKIYPNVWRRYCFYGAVYPPGPLAYEQSKDAQRFGT
jgi:hypothetical protein